MFPHYPHTPVVSMLATKRGALLMVTGLMQASSRRMTVQGFPCMRMVIQVLSNTLLEGIFTIAIWPKLANAQLSTTRPVFSANVSAIHILSIAMSGIFSFVNIKRPIDSASDCKCCLTKAGSGWPSA